MVLPLQAVQVQVAGADAQPLGVEFPTCAVCLLRLEWSLFPGLPGQQHRGEGGGALSGLGCRVCDAVAAAAGGDLTCAECDARHELWACLVCGSLGEGVRRPRAWGCPPTPPLAHLAV